MRKKQNYYYILSTRVFIHIVVCTDYYCWLPFFSILDFIIQIPFIFQLFFPYSFFFALKCVVKHGHILIVSLEKIYIVRDKAYRRMIQIFVKACSNNPIIKLKSTSTTSLFHKPIFLVRCSSSSEKRRALQQ